MSLDGELLAHTQSAVRTRYSPDGGAVQDPNDWWTAIKDGVRKVATSPGELAGIGITGQWGSTVPVDANGNAVGDCMLWADTRGGEFSAKAMGGAVSLFGYTPANMVRWIQLTGGAPSPNGADPLGHELYLRHRDPKTYAAAAKLVEPLDFIASRFTGRVAATPASMILSWLTDNRAGASPAYVPDLVRRSGRDPKRLPELLPTGSIAGHVQPEVAKELGIPSVPVVTGVPDLHTAFLGSGAVMPHQAHITISTTSWIACEVPFKRTDVLHQMATVPGLRQGAYLVANNHETAGVCLQWLRDLATPQPSYEEICRLAATAAPGSGGVIFTPWLKGERTPVEDRTLRAGFLNLSMGTGRAELARSVMEGVAFNARWLLDAVEGFVRRPLPSLRILGGGATSELWCQIHADILNRRIERVSNPMYANLHGAAMFAGISLGKLSIDDVRERVTVDRTFEPDASARAIYEPMYREFKHLYDRLHSVYARINR